MRVMQLLRIYTWRSFLQWMGMRGFIITLAINQAITPVLGLAVWSAALPGNPAITSYYLALLIVQLMTVSYEHHTFANGIYAGALNHDLVRPHPVVIAPLGENIAMRVWHLLVGFPLILIIGLVTSTSFELRNALFALPAIALAAALRFLFIYTLALAAFWTQQAHGVVGFGETLIFLLGGSAAPITLFPAAFRPLGEALPFRAMLGFPAEIVSGSLQNLQILYGYLWQGCWIVVFAVVASLVWRSGVRRYTAIGG